MVGVEDPSAAVQGVLAQVVGLVALAQSELGEVRTAAEYRGWSDGRGRALVGSGSTCPAQVARLPGSPDRPGRGSGRPPSAGWLDGRGRGPVASGLACPGRGGGSPYRQYRRG